MRCKACDRVLNDLEATNFDQKTGEYIDLCAACQLDDDYVLDLTWEESGHAEDQQYDIPDV